MHRLAVSVRKIEKPLTRWPRDGKSFETEKFNRLPPEEQFFLRADVLECGLPVLYVVDGTGSVQRDFYTIPGASRTPPPVSGTEFQGLGMTSLTEDGPTAHIATLIKERITVNGGATVKGDRATRIYCRSVPHIEDGAVIGAQLLHLEFEIDYRNALQGTQADRLFTIDIKGDEIRGAYRYFSRVNSVEATLEFNIDAQGNIQDVGSKRFRTDFGMRPSIALLEYAETIKAILACTKLTKVPDIREIIKLTQKPNHTPDEPIPKPEQLVLEGILTRPQGYPILYSR